MSPLVLFVPILALAAALAWLAMRMRGLSKAASEAAVTASKCDARRGKSSGAIREAVRLLKASPLTVLDAAPELVRPESTMNPENERRKDARRRAPRGRRPATDPVPPVRP